jgi:hypothetical protein
MKTNILSDNGLLDILENDTFISNEDFDFDSNNDIGDSFNNGDLSYSFVIDKLIFFSITNMLKKCHCMTTGFQLYKIYCLITKIFH